MSDTRDASDFPNPNSTQDPSMEEILASIRRILAEEQDGSKFLDEPEDELLLDKSMRVLPTNDLPDSEPELPEDGAPSPLSTTDETPSEADEDMKMADQIQRPEGFIDEQVAGQVVNSVGSLLRSISADRSVGVGRLGLTLEDMVREELKPMLKAWLDTHLPGLVERVVRTEITRVMDIAKD